MSLHHGHALRTQSQSTIGASHPPHPSRSFVAIHPPPLWGEGLALTGLTYGGWFHERRAPGSRIENPPPRNGSTCKLLRGVPMRGSGNPLRWSFQGVGFPKGRGKSKSLSPLVALSPISVNTEMGPRRGGRKPDDGNLRRIRTGAAAPEPPLCKGRWHSEAVPDPGISESCDFSLWFPPFFDII